MFHHKDPFIRMSAHALAGAALGLVAGLIFGLIIQYISVQFIPSELATDDGPWAVASFLGMGFGTLVGALMGGFSGLKR
jgi:uncharacterized membrane protein